MAKLFSKKIIPTDVPNKPCMKMRIRYPHVGTVDSHVILMFPNLLTKSQSSITAVCIPPRQCSGHSKKVLYALLSKDSCLPLLQECRISLQGLTAMMNNPQIFTA